MIDLDRLEAAAKAAQKQAPGRYTIALGSGYNLCTAIVAETEDGARVTVADFLPEWALKSLTAPLDHRPAMRYHALLEPEMVLEMIDLIRGMQRLGAEYDQKIRFLLGFAKLYGEDGCFTFPDGDTWERPEEVS